MELMKNISAKIVNTVLAFGVQTMPTVTIADLLHKNNLRVRICMTNIQTDTLTTAMGTKIKNGGT